MMANESGKTLESRTLAQVLAAGRMPLAEALRYAMMLANTLRKLHDEGRAHGALTPRCIVLSDQGLELLAVPGAITPYTAPEALEGRGADPRTDIFSFGAILYEMLTGNRAFAGEGAELAAALAGAPPAPSGSPIVDRLVANCLAKEPSARWPRMQKVLMELKLLTVAARRAEGATPALRAPAADLAPIRSEMQETEARIAARLEAHEQTMAAFQREVTDAVLKLREQLASLETRATAAQKETIAAAQLQAHERAVAGLREEVAEAVQALRGQLVALQNQLASVPAQDAAPVPDREGVEERITAALRSGLEAMGERIAGLEQSFEAAREHTLEFERNVAADFHDFEAGMKQQDAAVQSVRTALTQSDDVVERVVEALESIQAAIFDRSDDRISMAAAN